jgi:hypothetical protein
LRLLCEGFGDVHNVIISRFGGMRWKSLAEFALRVARFLVRQFKSARSCRTDDSASTQRRMPSRGLSHVEIPCDHCSDLCSGTRYPLLFKPA